MSHIVEIQTEVRDPAAVEAACQRLRLAPPVVGTAQLYSGAAGGLLVQLPDWRYPLVCDTAHGRLQFDNFNGRWGDPRRLDAFLQAYAVEKAKLEARRQGHTATETALADGSVLVRVQVAGATA